MLIADPHERMQRSARNQDRVLRWLREEKVTTPSMLTTVAGFKSRQAGNKLIRQLEKKSLIKIHEVSTPGISTIVLVGITAHGMAMSAEEGDVTDYSYCEPSRLSVALIPHQICLQKARLSAESAGWNEWVRGERLGRHPLIRPDAISTSPTQTRVAIEVERTIKTRRRYQQIIAGHLQMIRHGHWEEVHYLCPEKVRLPLQRVFLSISYVILAGQRVPLDDRHFARFSFHNLDQWPC